MAVAASGLLASVLVTVHHGSRGNMARIEAAAPSSQAPSVSPSPAGRRSAASVGQVTLPAGYALAKSAQGTVPDGKGSLITTLELRYTPGGKLTTGGPELLISLYTGAVSPPVMSQVKAVELTAHDVNLRPGTEVILGRDAAATGGITYYTWYEQGVLVSVIDMLKPIPGLERVVSSLRVYRP
jgi:hypothetical protein